MGIVGQLSRAWVVACLAVAACEDTGIVRQHDGGDAAPEGCPRPWWSRCNPLSAEGMQGCNPGQKCTSIVHQQGELLCPAIGCVPEGNLGEGEACEAALVGQGDACDAGLICVDGRCRDICGFDGEAGAACAVGFTCTRHDDLFLDYDGAEPSYGVCIPAAIRF